MNKLAKWDEDLLNLKPRDLALCRIVYALQLEHRYHTSKTLENIVENVFDNFGISDVVSEGIKFSKFSNGYGFFKVRPSKKMLTLSTDLVRIKRKNGLVHRRVHYRKGWEETRVITQKVIDCRVLERKHT